MRKVPSAKAGKTASGNTVDSGLTLAFAKPLARAAHELRGFGRALTLARRFASSAKGQQP